MPDTDPQEVAFWLGRMESFAASRLAGAEQTEFPEIVSAAKHRLTPLVGDGALLAQISRVEAAFKRLAAAEERIAKLTRERDDWKEDARRYSGNADYWKGRYETAQLDCNLTMGKLESAESRLAEARRALETFKRIAFLIGSIYFYGNFKAETVNESELEKLLRETGYFFETEESVLSALEGER